MSKGRILVVEDEGVVALDLQHRLRGLGYEVPVTVPTGDEAVHESKRLRPDLILMDIRLKGHKDGVAAAQELRTDTDVPVVFLTAYADENTVMRSKQVEPFGYILKPFQERELSATIEIALFKHRTERQLRHRERWFSAILRGIGDGVIAADTDSKIAFVNPVAEKLTGWRGDDALGRHADEIFQLVDERTQAPLENPITTALRTGGAMNIPRGALLVAKDGCTTPVDDSVAVIRDEQGNAWGAVLAFHDIVERKQNERRLMESEQRFRAIFESVNDAVLVHDLEGERTVDANGRASEMLGRTREEMRRTGIDSWGLTETPYSRADALSWLRKAAHGQPQVFEWQSRHRSGRTVMLEVNLKRARIAGEDRILATMRDITQRQMLQEQLFKSKKMEAIGQLAGGVAHDFNNLLTVINGHTSLLLEELGDNATNLSHAIQILNAGERAAGLTRQLLALGRRQTMQRETLDLNRLVGGIGQMLRHVIKEDIDFTMNLGPGLAKVAGDPVQIEQVILNLVFNARDAMPDGGQMAVETRNVTLGDEFAQVALPVPPGDYVMLAVTDTGIGMDDRTRSRLFEPFFTTKEQGKGTGLGLATVFGIVKQSGGHISVESELNQGTVFRIYFPVAQPGDETRVEGGKSSRSLSGHETILLVEDDAGVRELVQETLMRFGYSVLAARDVDDAIRLFESRGDSIDLLLTDVVMPRMNGRDLARTLQDERPDLRVVYMSGYADSAIVRGGTLEPGLMFLQKPFTREGLGRKIRDALDV